MNCSPSDSKNLTKCQVVSKYFSKTVMDESLTEFQEKKKIFTGPKDTQKPKTKAKKSAKRIRGQKDIRTALKPKKNDLVAFSNEFDKVCKQSGIDVDPEQLQLAVALSKSLQKSEDNLGLAQSSGSLTAQDRSGKIRTTLIEYGFVVPEVKITTAKSKKLKKYRKNYKLLVATTEEKQQIISDKYSKVLFDNFESSKVSSTSKDTLHDNTRLYNLASNISYELIKDNHIFYIESLFEKSESTIGCLLRDWSEIPGRPISPICEVSKLDFTKVDCSQTELDSVLAGSIKTAQGIVINKYCIVSETTEDKSQIDTDSKQDLNKMDTTDVEIVEINFENSKAKESIELNKNNIDTKFNSNHIRVTQQVRRYSPDIFDDEISSILESSRHSFDSKSPKNDAKNHNVFKSQELPIKNVTKVCEDIMDLTECVVVNSQRSNGKVLSQLSQGTNNIIDNTKRRSNDFMDMTDCVTGSSQPIREAKVEQEIDLTQNSDENITPDDVDKTVESLKHVESMDLTQSSESNDMPFVHVSGTDSKDNTIIVNESYSELNNYTEKVDSEHKNKDDTVATSPIFLSPEYNTPEEDKVQEPIEILSDNENHFNITANKLEARAISPIIDHINDVITENAIARSDEKLSETLNSSRESVSQRKDYCVRSKTESFFEEFVYQHSGSSKEKTNEVLGLEGSDLGVSIISGNDKEDIDLTQTSDSSEENSCKINKEDSSQIPTNVDATNMSTGCDEMFDDMIKSHASSSKTISYKSDITDSNADNQMKSKTLNSDVQSSSQYSEVFEISDNELDYSLQKSKFDVNYGIDNFDFGGISVVNNLPDLPSIRKSRTTFNRSLSESYLPEVDVKSKDHHSTVNILNQSCSSPKQRSCKESITDLIVKTPKNSEYEIKTDDVTPMRDYETMSTPEMHEELDKYGLKPFKRKRAIQLLTHIYNQTHPILQSCSTVDQPSPSKKFKKSVSPKKICNNFSKSPKKGASPRKLMNDREDNVLEIENYIYDVTNEMPDVRDLECGEDDWVFQKREKAKVHSCRVPLHISFHNYVSTRLRLQEAILRYEPINIDVIHKGLVSNGFRYDPKDLLKFMDKKCITVKTADNNSRNKKHY